MIDRNDDKAWSLYKDGLTKGLFQLESNLGRAWSKRVIPKNLEELGALIAIIRPGTLKAVSDGKSMTQRFVDRKHLVEEVEYLHPSLEDILDTTYGVLVYQEQAMRIAVKLAGFNEMEADNLRKAIGKKKAALMAEIRIQFLEGCDNVGLVDDDTANQIFDWIEKSSRYSFNKSHAISYALDSYWTAYYKANHTKEFFLAYLYYAHQKQDPKQEIYELVSEAKMFDIEVTTPKVHRFSEKFAIFGDDIQFGIRDIKGLTGVTGTKVVKAIQETSVEIDKSLQELTWMDVLVYIAPKITSPAFKALASVGFFSTKKTGVTRNEALYEYLIWKELTKKEVEWVVNNYPDKKWTDFAECLVELAPTKKDGGGCSNVNRSKIVFNEVEMLANPPYSLKDDPQWVIATEVGLLGCPVSYQHTDAIDTSIANTTCKEVLDGKTGEGVCIVANVRRVSNHKINKQSSTQKGRIMSFLTIEDSTSSLDSVVIFPDARDKYQFILYEGANLMLCGKVDAKDSSFIIDKIHEI